MIAAVVTGRRRFEIRELPKPKVMPGTLLLKVKRCAICGTDLEYVDSPRWDGDEGGIPFGANEAILGHEWVGEVVEIGDGVTGWDIGDRSVDARTSCGACHWCARGLPHLCIGGPTRATTVPDVSTSTNSPTDWKRSPGIFANAFSTARFT